MSKQASSESLSSTPSSVIGLSSGDISDHSSSAGYKFSDEPADSFATNTHVALRSLHTPLPQSDPQNGPSLVGDVKLSQRTRKGHKKSRQGCYNCKRRKIKCQENLPACDNCIRKSLVCEYPIVKTNSMIQALSSSLTPTSPVNLQTTPVFSLADMRLFHHFLLHAYPHLPLHNDCVWVNQIPLIAHEYEYLMHALLGLAASHLTITSDSDYSSSALSHRFLAIKGLNEALSITPRTGHDGDALLASCFALTFQSSYMTDGLHEFLTFLRGCNLVSAQLTKENVKVSFDFASGKNPLPRDDLPGINPDFIQEAASSLELFLSIIQEGCINFELYNALKDCVQSSICSSQEGYMKFLRIFALLGKMDQEKFHEFTLPDNTIGELLLAHFFALEMVMAPIADYEWSKHRDDRPRYDCLMQWILKIRDEMGPPMQDFIAWPASISTLMLGEVNGVRPL